MDITDGYHRWVKRGLKKRLKAQGKPPETYLSLCGHTQASSRGTIDDETRMRYSHSTHIRIP